MAKAIILATALRGTRRGRHSAISCCSCGNLRPRTLPCALAPPSGAAVSSRRRVCLVCRVLSVPSVWSVCLSVSWLRLLGTGCRGQSTPGERRALRVYPRSRKPRRGRRRAPSTAGSPALRCCLAQASHGQEACNARFDHSYPPSCWAQHFWLSAGSGRKGVPRRPAQQQAFAFAHCSCGGQPEKIFFAAH